MDLRLSLYAALVVHTLKINVCLSVDVIFPLKTFSTNSSPSIDFSLQDDFHLSVISLNVTVFIHLSILRFCHQLSFLPPTF